MFLFQNLSFIRPENFDALPDLKKRQVLHFFNLHQFEDENAFALVKKELAEFPCEWWEVVDVNSPQTPIYNFVVAYEDGHAFIAGTLEPAEIYVSQNAIQYDEDPNVEASLQKAFYKRSKPDYKK